MYQYSVTQAISPAIESTKRYLFGPFRTGRFLKLTLVAVLTQGGMSSCNFNTGLPSGTSSSPFHLPNWNWPTMPIIVGIAIAAVLILIPLSILIGYLLIRLRFSFFDCALRRQDRIAPGWSRYHRQAMRYLGLTLCIGLAFWIFLTAAGFAVYFHWKPLFDAITSRSRPDFSEFLPLFAIIVPLILLLAFLGFLVETTLSTFVLPHMALEDASIVDSLGDVWSDIQAEPGAFVFFVFMRFLVSLAASIIGLIVLLIPFLVVAGIGALIVILLKSVSTELAIFLGVPAGIIVAGLFILAGIGVSGMIGTFRLYYSFYFYGSRYPPLGAILEPPLLVPPFPQPPWERGISPGVIGGV